MNLKKIGKVFTSKFVGTVPSYYKKIIYRAAVSQRLRNTDLETRERIIILVVAWNNIETNLKQISVKMYSGFIYVRIGSNAVFLKTGG